MDQKHLRGGGGTQHPEINSHRKVKAELGDHRLLPKHKGPQHDGVLQDREGEEPVEKRERISPAEKVEAEFGQRERALSGQVPQDVKGSAHEARVRGRQLLQVLARVFLLIFLSPQSVLVISWHSL